MKPLSKDMDFPSEESVRKDIITPPPQLLSSHYQENEISLVDLWLTLARHKKLIAGIMFAALAVALVIAIFTTRQYTYSTLIEPGTIIERTDQGYELRQIDKPDDVVAKLKDTYIPLALHNLKYEQESQPDRFVNVRTPKNSQIIVLESRGTAQDAEAHKTLHKAIIERLALDQETLFIANRSRLEDELALAKIKLQEAEDPVTLSVREKQLQASITDSQLKLDELKDPRILEVSKKSLETQLESGKAKLAALEDEAKYLKLQRDRLDEMERQLKKQADDIGNQTQTALSQRDKAIAEVSNDAKALTILMIDSEIQQKRYRLSDMEERLYITLPNQRDDLDKRITNNNLERNTQIQKNSEIEAQLVKLFVDNERARARIQPQLAELESQIAKLKADNVRSIASQRQLVSQIESQLGILQQTRAIEAGVRSLTPAGPGKKIIVVLGLVLGLLAGILAAFLAEFFAKTRARTATIAVN